MQIHESICKVIICLQHCLIENQAAISQWAIFIERVEGNAGLPSDEGDILWCSPSWTSLLHCAAHFQPGDTQRNFRYWRIDIGKAFLLLDGSAFCMHLGSSLQWLPPPLFWKVGLSRESRKSFFSSRYTFHHQNGFADLVSSTMLHFCMHQVGLLWR